MLFNKGLALGGVMLAAAIPGSAAFAQTSSPTPATSKASAPVATAQTRVQLSKASTTAKVVSAKPTAAGFVIASNTPAKSGTALVPVAANMPAAVKPAPAPEPTVVGTLIGAVSGAAGAVIGAVTGAIDAVAGVVSTPAPKEEVVQASFTAPESTDPDPAGDPAELINDSVAPTVSTLGGVPIAKVFTVSTPAELRAALVAAQTLAGAEIRVNPGNYGLLDWSRRKYPLGRVFVVAATSTRPVFLGIMANESSNMSFHGMKVTGGTGKLVQLNSARNMTFTSGDISGVTQDGDPWDEGATAVQVRFSTNVTVQDTKFSDVRAAMYVQRSSNVNIRYNRISHVREGLNIVATDQVLVQGNHFSNFYPKYDIGEHPDAIQLWTNGETVGSTRVRIRENLISMGGKRAVQGVLSGCEAAGVRHRDWELTQNVYYGSSVHGLSFNCVDGLKVWNNVVVASPHADVNNSIRSPDGRESGGYLPRIRVRTSTAVETWNNVIMAGVSTDAPVTNSDNWDLVDAMGWGGLPWTDVFARGRPTIESPVLSAFVTRNPSLVRTRNGGVVASYTLGVRSMTKAAALTDALGLLEPQ